MSKYIYYVARCSYPAWRGVHWYTTIGATDKSVREKNPNAIEIEVDTVAFDSEKPVVQVWWEKQLEKQRDRMNAYYSQKWV
jgi:hypothetical protein